jgi:hypothetical protein
MTTRQSIWAKPIEECKDQNRNHGKDIVRRLWTAGIGQEPDSLAIATQSIQTKPKKDPALELGRITKTLSRDMNLTGERAIGFEPTTSSLGS